MKLSNGTVKSVKHWPTTNISKTTFWTHATLTNIKIKPQNQHWIKKKSRENKPF